MRRIKIAQIGTSTNSHGNDIFNTLKRNSDLFEVVGYVLPENEREKFPERMSDFDGCKELTLDEILNNPEIEAVTVETEEVFLTKYALMAAEHKKHIHMEKPGGLDYELFKKLIDCVKSNGTVFHIGYMYRYNPYVIDLINQVKNGELGKIISVEAQMNCLHKKEVRQWLNNFPGGMLFFLGCHIIDLIFTIQGVPKRIIPLSKCSAVEGVNSEDFGMVAYEYENGISFAKTSSVEVGGFERRQLVVSGEKKTIELRPMEWFCEGGQYTKRFIKENPDWQAEFKTERSHIYTRYDSMMKSFAEIILGKKQNAYSYDYELELYKLILESCGCDLSNTL